MSQENYPSKSKRFEDWEEVDCNECSRYWDNSCDAVKKGSTRLCNSFLATRSVVLPKEIKELKKAFKTLLWAYGVLAVFVLLRYLLDFVL